MAEKEDGASEEQARPRQIAFQVTMDDRGQLSIKHTEGASPVILLGMLSTAEMLVKKKFGGEAKRSPLVTPTMGGGVPQM